MNCKIRNTSRITITTNKENPMSKSTKSSKKSAAKKVVVVRRPRKHSVLDGIPVGVPVNVKVAGERVMRKNVTLHVRDAEEGTLLLRTGSRGRPPVLHATDIVKVRAL